MKKRFLKSQIKFSTGIAPEGTVWTKDLPFRRSWKIIFILLLVGTALCIPLYMNLDTLIEELKSFDSLFDLISVIFLAAWMIGWSIAPLIIIVIAMLLLFGRERIMARPGVVNLAVGIPGLMVLFEMDVKNMRNIRHETPLANSGKTWRGPHLAFDYKDWVVSVGSDIDLLESAKLISQLEMSIGRQIPKGPRAESRSVDQIKEVFRKRRAMRMQTGSEQGAQDGDPPRLFSLSTFFLVLANLVPIAGTVYFGWDMSSVLIIYWAESGIIGIFNLFKMLAISGIAGLFQGVFFLAHFSGFMAIHFLFLYELFIQGVNSSSSASLSEATALLKDIWPALAALFISHGVSFFQNFIGKKEYINKPLRKQMHEPYRRIIFMQLVLIIGAWLVVLVGDITAVLIIIMLAKIAVDVRAHIQERRQ